MIDVKWEPFIHVYPACLVVFGYSQGFPWLFLQQAGPVSEGGPVDRMSMVCALSRSCAPHRLDSSRSNILGLKRGGETNVYHWLPSETHLMPSLFLATYNCRRINVKVSVFPTHSEIRAAKAIKKINKNQGIRKARVSG